MCLCVLVCEKYEIAVGLFGVASYRVSDKKKIDEFMRHPSTRKASQFDDSTRRPKAVPIGRNFDPKIRTTKVNGMNE